MKTKGISFWEQNIERFVVGFALLVCLVLVAMQFLGEPNAVQVGGRTISPGEVDEQLETKAFEIDQKLDESRQYVFGAEVEPVFAKLDQRLSTPVVPAPRLALSSPTIAPTGDSGVDPNRPWVDPPVPAPSALAVNQHFDTIRPEVVEATNGLSAAIGAASAPFDVTWNTVSAKFDGAGFLKAYSTDGANGEAAYLLSWYNNRVDFIDLKLEREEYIEGVWTNAKVIDPMPGYRSFRLELEGKKIDDSLRTRVLSEAVDPAVRAQIIQPPFYSTLTESWTPPNAQGDAEAIAPDDPAASLKQERAEIKKKLDAVLKNLKKMGCPDVPPAPVEPPKPAGGGGGGSEAAPGSGVNETSGGNAGGLRSGGTAVDLSKCESGWRRKRQFETSLAKLDAEIEKITGQATEKPKDAVEAEEVETIIDVWAHDLDVKPGKTYRYRLSVEVYNPLFGRKLDLIPAQQPLAEKFTKVSAASEWTQPTTAQPPLRMFVTQARSSNPNAVGMALGQITAEVYRFHDGRWWQESFAVTPGDRIGDLKASRGGAEVDYGTDWFVLDIVPTLGATRQDEDAGYGAMVMLQSLSDPGAIEWRSPREDMADTERRSLNGRVKLAELEAVASSDGGGEGTAAN